MGFLDSLSGGENDPLTEALTRILLRGRSPEEVAAGPRGGLLGGRDAEIWSEKDLIAKKLRDLKQGEIYGANPEVPDVPSAVFGLAASGGGLPGEVSRSTVPELERVAANRGRTKFRGIPIQEQPIQEQNRLLAEQDAGRLLSKDPRIPEFKTTGILENGGELSISFMRNNAPDKELMRKQMEDLAPGHTATIEPRQSSFSPDQITYKVNFWDSGGRRSGKIAKSVQDSLGGGLRREQTDPNIRNFFGMDEVQQKHPRPERTIYSIEPVQTDRTGKLTTEYRVISKDADTNEFIMTMGQHTSKRAAEQQASKLNRPPTAPRSMIQDELRKSTSSPRGGDEALKTEYVITMPEPEPPNAGPDWYPKEFEVGTVRAIGDKQALEIAKKKFGKGAAIAGEVDELRKSAELADLAVSGGMLPEKVKGAAQSLPPVPEGMTRVFRVEGKSAKKAGAAEGVRGGDWFETSLGAYVSPETTPENVLYVDIPTARFKQLQSDPNATEVRLPPGYLARAKPIS